MIQAEPGEIFECPLFWEAFTAIGEGHERVELRFDVPVRASAQVKIARFAARRAKNRRVKSFELIWIVALLRPLTKEHLGVVHMWILEKIIQKSELLKQGWEAVNDIAARELRLVKTFGVGKTRCTGSVRLPYDFRVSAERLEQLIQYAD